MKKIAVLILTLAMLLSLTAVQAAADTPAPDSAVTAPEDADGQIALLYAQLRDLAQDDSYARWSYTVADLDHNGRLELLAGTILGDGRYTNARAWQVNEARNGLEELNIPVAEGDSFPDIIIDAADSFHDTVTDIWYYMFNDHVTASSTDVYANKSAITLVGNDLRFYTYAYQHSEWVNGRMVVSFTDRDGNAITPEEYNAADRNVFSDMEHGSVRLDWFLAAELSGAARLSDSYAVFLGLKQPPKPVTPSPAPAPSPTPTPAPTPAPPSAILVVTKNPTDEYRYAGETAWFVAKADNWTSANWSFVDPYGNECSWQSFQNRFYGSGVSGGNSASITISKLDIGMNGWGAYCTFYGNGQITSTATAFFRISAAPQPTPPPAPAPTLGPVYGSMNGYVSDYLMSTVTIALENGSSVQLLKDICTVDGNLGYGCSATVYYTNYPSKDTITACYIQGTHDPEPPSGGSMGATFIGATMDSVGFRLENGAYVNVSRDICTNYGSPRNGDSATVYYSGPAPSDGSIYHVDVYGRLYDDDAGGPGGSSDVSPGGPGGSSGGSSDVSPGGPGGSSGVSPGGPGGSSDVSPGGPGGSSDASPGGPGGSSDVSPGGPGGSSDAGPGGGTPYDPSVNQNIYSDGNVFIVSGSG